MRDRSGDVDVEPPLPKKVQRVVDPVDRRILRLLVDDARITNAALAERVGIAPSTAWCGCARCGSRG